MRLAGLLAIAAMLLAIGCARVHVACPTDGSTTTVGVGGSTVGLTALSILAQAATTGGAGLMLSKGPPRATPTASGSTVDYDYLAIFGSDYVTCGQSLPPAPPAPAPSPVIIVVPAGPPSPTILKAPEVQ